MNYLAIVEKLKPILGLFIPVIQKLIESKVVPMLKRKMYETLNKRADKLIDDLAQNVGKAVDEADPKKKKAYIEGSLLGIEALELLSEKLKETAGVLREEIKDGKEA